MNSISSHSSELQSSSPLQSFSTDFDSLATKIQKTVRGFFARKSFLPRSLYPVYKNQCEFLNPSTPRAGEGKTTVYLPPDCPEIVIKETEIIQAKKRFEQNEAIRSVLRKEGLNRLIIPRSRLHKEYLIEERLPISSDARYNANLYLSSPELFDDVARQMTHLFKKAYIDYLVEKNKDDDHLIRIRYDNIPFLVREQNGMQTIDIGLIDLERSSVGDKIKCIRHKLYILSSLFPLHVSLIEEEALKNGMEIGLEEKEKMEKALFYSKCYLEKMALEHSKTQTSSYITYQDVSQRRFGDALITYLHAKWIAFQSNLPLLYRPFPYSCDLVLNDLEIKYDTEEQKGAKEIKYKKNFQMPNSSESVPTIYSVHYFPECSW